MNNYDIFSGDDLKIADLIQRRRLQLLIHSSIYYNMDKNIISDRQWDMWAKELVQLQTSYPEISAKVIWYDAFADWDASTGAFLPLDDDWVIQKAHQLLRSGTKIERSSNKENPKQVKKEIVKKKGRLF